MTREEYLAVLATEPATSTQVGAILGEFERLGVVDRGERLAISAELLALKELGSTADLVMGDAGRLFAVLRHTRDRAELPDVAAAAVDGDQADADAGEQVMVVQVLRQIAALIHLLFADGQNAGSRQNLAGKFPDFARDRPSLFAVTFRIPVRKRSRAR